MAITADAGVTFIGFDANVGGHVAAFEVGASEVIVRGGAVTADAGYASTFNAAEHFIGIALEGKTGGSSDGDERVRCQISGVAKLAISGVTVADIGEGVYATDNATYTLATTSSNAIGRVVHVPVTGTAWVQLRIVGDGVIQASAVAEPA